MSYLADSIKLIITLLLYKIPISSSPTSATMPLESHVDVLIIGAGPAGLMCANALSGTRNGRRRGSLINGTEHLRQPRIAISAWVLIDSSPTKVVAGQADGIAPGSGLRKTKDSGD